MWSTWRFIIARSSSSWPAELAIGAEQVQRVADRCERIAQLMAQHREELILAACGLGERVARALEVFQMGADLVLPLACAQRGAHGAHQCGQPQRTLEHGDVAELRDRVADLLGIGATARQHEHRQVRPAGLPFHGVDQRGLCAVRE